MNAGMTPFLLRSGAAHALVVLLAFLFMAANGRANKVFYTIDFVGGTAGPRGGGGTQAAPTPAPAPSKATVPLKAPLPSLKRWRDKARAATLKAAEMATPSKAKGAEKAVEASPVMGTTSKETPAASTGAGPPKAEAGASVSADLSNFPYPWYLARLRDALWTQWSARMPDGSSACVVSFVIARNGTVTEIKVGEGSGSSSFDYAAQSAVRAAAPFPPLPEGYADPTLRVHVRFETVP